jgi:hypothetical protein
MRIISAAILLLLSTLTLQAQVDRTNFRAGINAGIVVGDNADLYSFSLGLDILHVWGLSREIDLGLATGFNNAFGEEETITSGGIMVSTEFANLQYIPAAIALRIYPTYGFKFGGDLGYAIGVSDGFEGGFYYKPVIGVDINGSTELNISYVGINEEVTFSTVMIGVLFLF